MADSKPEFDQSDSGYDRVEYNEAGVEFMRWIARRVVRQLKMKQKPSGGNEFKSTNTQ